MKHYLIIRDYAFDFSTSFKIIGITHSMKKAKKIFNDNVNDDIKYAKDNDFIIHIDDDTQFDAGEEGCYSENHTNLYIEIV